MKYRERDIMKVSREYFKGREGEDANKTRLLWYGKIGIITEDYDYKIANKYYFYTINIACVMFTFFGSIIISTGLPARLKRISSYFSCHAT